MKTQVELLKECCDIKDAACVRYQKRIAELEEENKKLKAELETATKCSSQEEGKLRNLEKENKKLKSDLAFERTMLDNVRAEYNSLQEVIKKLKEDVEYFRQIYLDLKKMCEDDGYLLTDE